jgi:hypothetical protein
MMTADDVKRLQTAVTSQQAGNNIMGTIGLKGGFACTSSGGVLGSVVGPFVVIPGSAFGEPAGVYRVYPQAFGQPSKNPQSGASTPTFNPYTGNQGQILSIDFFNVSGFTPRSPGSTETASALVTGYNIDAANNQWYITVQISTLTTGAILSTPPTNFVVGIEAAVTLSSNANPL